MPLDAVTGTLLGVLAGGAFSSATALGTLWITKRAEERRHRREMAIQIATEHWKRFCSDFDRIGRKDVLATTPGAFDVFFAHALRGIEAFDTGCRVTADDIAKSYALMKQTYESAFDGKATNHQ